MKPKYLTFLAFLTATASVIYIVESLIFRMLPLPFLRLGLSNIVVLYLIWQRRIFSAIIVNLAKSIVGGIATFTLLSPTVILSGRRLYRGLDHEHRAFNVSTVQPHGNQYFGCYLTQSHPVSLGQISDYHQRQSFCVDTNPNLIWLD